MSSEPLKDDFGQVTEALQDSEARYRRLFETAKDGILILDAKSGLITDVNPFLIHLLDYAREDFLGKTLWDIGPFRHIEASKAAFRELQNEEYIRYEDLPLETRSGKRVNVEFVSNVYEVNGDRVIQCNIRDITVRKQAAESLAVHARKLALQSEELIRAQLALADKTVMLRSVLDSISEGLLVADTDGKFLIWNPAAREMLGLDAADVEIQEWSHYYGLYLTDKVTPFPSDQLPLARAIRGEAATAVMFVRNSGVGEGVFLEAYASPLKDKDGTLQGGVVALRDITKRKQAEETLREYARVVEGLEEMILVVDRNYRYVIANRAFLNFRGVDAEQVVGRSAQEVVGKEVFASVVKERMDECFRGQVVQYEMNYDFPNHGNRDLFASYFPIPGESGIDRIACVFQDITERKRAELALHNSEERFSKAFRNNPLAITISAEADGRYLDVNDAFLALLGYERKDVIGRTAADLRFWGEPIDRLAMLRQLRESEKVTKHHSQYRTATGEVREAEVWVESIELDGQACLLKITRDITEIQQLEAQFRQAQKMEAVGRLAGGVAHDFNNMLGVIMGYSDISFSLVPAESSISRYLLEIRKAAQRAALLTQQLMAFSRKQVVFPKILDLNDVVHNATSMFLRLVGEDIAVEFRPAKLLARIKADPGQIEQVLMNLVVNARDAMPTGGRIIIETKQAEMDVHYVSRHPGAHIGPNVVLVVSDTGCGMDEDVKSKIFEPFFTTKGAGVGTGLGLSTVYGIVKQSGAYIAVYSEPGKGTTFKIYFPRVGEQAEVLTAPQEEAEPPRGSHTILLVEDDAALRDLTAKLLEGSGYRVVEAKDAEDALKIIGTAEPEIDLLLTDVILPGRSGAELVKQAAEDNPKLCSLFMSGYTSDLAGRQGILMQEGSFLEKPFTRRSLLEKVYSALHNQPPK